MENFVLSFAMGDQFAMGINDKEMCLAARGGKRERLNEFFLTSLFFFNDAQFLIGCA